MLAIQLAIRARRLLDSIMISQQQNVSILTIKADSETITILCQKLIVKYSVLKVSVSIKVYDNIVCFQYNAKLVHRCVSAINHNDVHPIQVVHQHIIVR
jgi:hypothetical protein